MTQSFLVVDPDPITRNILTTTLELKFNSPHIRETPDGEEAIDLMLEEPADTLISDVHPESISGIELGMIVNDPDNGWPETNFILMSDNKPNDLINMIIKIWRLGGDFYPKPLDVSLMAYRTSRTIV